MKCPIPSCSQYFVNRRAQVAHLSGGFHHVTELAEYLADTTVPNGDVPCRRMQRFASKPLAQMALVLTAPLPRRPYFCGGCGGYHLRTHQPNGRTHR